ncbi:MAG: alpha/beta hydrolase family esterase [Bradymonadia bacterium]
MKHTLTLYLLASTALCATGCDDDGGSASDPGMVEPDAAAHAADSGVGAHDAEVESVDSTIDNETDSTVEPADAEMMIEDPEPLPTTFGGDRPVELWVPDDYDPAEPRPLFVLLHGYFRNPDYILDGFRAQALFETSGALMMAPDGQANPEGEHYWNAAPACCDFFRSGVDDVAYLGGLIEEVQGVYNVDPKRIYVMGHSNGAFMSMRLACERADLVAAVISVAGAAAPADCTPSEPVSVLHAHGESDEVIAYAGGRILGSSYPGAEATVAQWAGADFNGCSAETEALESVDYSLVEPGAETRVIQYTGCPEGIGVELWTHPNGPHAPQLSEAVPGLWTDWLMAHPKP